MIFDNVLLLLLRAEKEDKVKSVGMYKSRKSENDKAEMNRGGLKHGHFMKTRFAVAGNVKNASGIHG